MKTNKTATTISDNPSISRKITRYQNVDENEIVITETRLENILMKHKEAISLGNDWKTPLGLIIAIFIVFPTTEFNKNFLGFEPSAWKLFFFVVLVASCCWLCWSLVIKWKNRNKNIGHLISLIKNENAKAKEQKNVK